MGLVNQLQEGFGSCLTTCPRAGFRISAIDLGMASGNQLLLDIRPMSNQLSNSAAIPIGVDPPDGDRLAFQVAAQIIPSCLGWHWIRVSPAEFRGIDASQSNLLASGGGAGIAVIAIAD